MHWNLKVVFDLKVDNGTSSLSSNSAAISKLHAGSHSGKMRTCLCHLSVHHVSKYLAKAMFVIN